MPNRSPEVEEPLPVVRSAVWPSCTPPKEAHFGTTRPGAVPEGTSWVSEANKTRLEHPNTAPATLH